MIYKYIIKNIGARTLPCGTPRLAPCQSEHVSHTFTCCMLLRNGNLQEAYNFCC